MAGGGGTINGAGGSGNVGGGGRGNARGGGIGNTGRGEQSRSNTRSGQQHASWGNRPTTAYGAPGHMGKYGTTALPETATPGKPAMSWSSWKDQVDTYNAAANKWNKSAAQISPQNLLNNMSPYGFSMQAPELNKPKTYTGGDYHLGVNPAELAGGLLSMYGSGLISGPVAGNVYTAMGGQNVMLGGPGVPSGWDPKGATPATPNAPNTQGNGTPSSGNMANTGNGGSWGGPSQVATSAPGGAPFGAQPAPTGGNSGGFFTPQLPNHSLPKGYTSMFPNSLSEQDKALLYAQALGGA